MVACLLSIHDMDARIPHIVYRVSRVHVAQDFFRPHTGKGTHCIRASGKVGIVFLVRVDFLRYAVLFVQVLITAPLACNVLDGYSLKFSCGMRQTATGSLKPMVSHL